MTAGIRQWLEALGLSKYADGFDANDVDVSLVRISTNLKPPERLAS